MRHCRISATVAFGSTVAKAAQYQMVLFYSGITLTDAPGTFFCGKRAAFFCLISEIH